MSRKKIKCYLCKNDADQLIIDNSRNEIIECPHCVNRYEITERVLRFYIYGEGENRLNDDEVEKLHEYVKKQSRSVKLDSETVKRVTGRK